MKKLILILSIFGCWVSTQAQNEIDRSKQPEPGPVPTINLKEADRYDLNNGIKLLIVEDHKLPRVSIQLAIDNPPYAEGDKVGVGSLLSSLLGKGSKNISKDEFNEEIDFLGARLNFGSEGGFASTLSMGRIICATITCWVFARFRAAGDFMRLSTRYQQTLYKKYAVLQRVAVSI